MGRHREQAKKDGSSIATCGGSKQKKEAKGKYPKCVPLAKATRMTEFAKGECCSHEKELQVIQDGKPTNVATFTKRNKKASGGSVGDSMIRQAQRDYKGTYISGDLGGVKVSNPSYKKYYKGMI